MSAPKNKEAGGAEGKKKLSPAVIIAAAALVVILVLVIVIVCILNRKEERPELSGRATIVTEDNVQEIMQSMSAQQSTDTTYTATMTNEWNFADGTAAAENFYVKNAESNSRTVYFELQLEDTGEVIYSSPYIPVGEEMNTMTLDKDLDAGDYNVIMTYYLVDDDNVELTTVSVRVVIHIQN